ncbi:MAG: sensor histidine kinase, partial [Anaerolineae bacterium]|nr:sensor histidine kinase [Anaerolineae bacterium]
DQVKATLANPLDYVLSLAEAGLAEMRALIFELRPDALEKEGLVAALTKQAEAIRARHKLDMHTDFCSELPDLPLATKEALYRVAQEALNNLIKHAEARRVVLRLRCVPGILTLEVQDDGVGFDPQADYPGHLGLHTMRERVERLGGGLAIESAPGAGTTVQATFPLP